MPQIETWLNQDLKKAVKVQYLDGNLFSMDNSGNLIGVLLTNNGESYSGGGTVAANVIRSDGTTVAVPGALSGNAATVVLPQSAYTVPGVLSVVIKLTKSGAVTTIGAVVANVYRSSTDTVVDPGTIIPDISALVAQINAAVASIPADYSSLWTTLAPAFSAGTSYVAGQYVTYDGGLYRFTTSHSGTWSSGDVTAVTVGGEIEGFNSEVASIRSAITPVMPESIYTAEEMGNLLANATDWLTDKYYSIGNNGKITEVSLSGYTGFIIEVDQNTNYAFTFGRHVCFLGSDKQTSVSDRIQSVTTCNSGSAYYLAVSFSYTTYPIGSYIFCKGLETDNVSNELKYTYPWMGTKARNIEGAQETGNLIPNAIGWLKDQYYVVGGTGKIIPSDGENYTGFKIKVKQNTDYAFTFARHVYFLAEDGETSIAERAVSVTTCNSGSAYWLAVNFNTADYPVDTYIMCEGVSTYGKGEYKVFLPWLDGAGVSETPDILYGKKWAVCGDSFTNSGGTGTGTMPAGTKYAGKPFTYPWIIGSRMNMTIAQFFEGGRTLAFPAVPETFVNSLTCPNQTYYYQNIPADADYITIYLGINDNHHATGGGDGEDPTGYIPLGEITDETTASYYGAWNVVLTWLITNRPNAHIGIIVTNGIQSNDNYRLAQIAIAKKYGIPYIDMNGDERTPAMLRTSNPNIPESIKYALRQKWAVNPGINDHPNDAAQLFESTFIENFLRSL